MNPPLVGDDGGDSKGAGSSRRCQAPLVIGLGLRDGDRSSSEPQFAFSLIKVLVVGAHYPWSWWMPLD
jgi:hypothetical protein